MILLTGANGQLGQDFQKYFNQQGILYLATDYMAVNGCQALDITDKAAIEAFMDRNEIEIIINCAAYNDVDKAETEPEKAYALNSEAAKNLAEAAREHGSVLVTYSTDFVFDGRKQAPYREDDQPNPLSVYGKAKSRGEQEVFTAYAQAFIIRTSWVFGMGNNNFNKSVIRWSKTNPELRIVDDQISVPTYSWDLAVYSWELIQTRRYGLYHLVNQGEASKYDQAKYVLEKIGWQGNLLPVKTEEFRLPAPRPAYSRLDSSRAETIIGRKMPDWTDAVDRFLDEMRKSEEIR